MRQLLFALLITAGIPSGYAQNTDFNAVNQQVTQEHVLPAYAAFAKASEVLAQQAKGFCGDLSPESLAAMQQAFGASFDGWQGVQHIQFGPITYFNWNYRLQFWPDDNGTGARQLTVLLAGGDTSVLATETFARQSVGVQGYPALERLLYEDDSLGLLQREPFRCQVVQTIAANLGEMASGVYAQWANEFQNTVINADDRAYFESAQDAAIEYMKALVEGVRRVKQQKLEPALGESLAGARPKRAEAWRSERSVHNVQVNMAAFANLYSVGEPALRTVIAPADLVAVDASLAAAQRAVAALPASLTQALASEDGYATVVLARDALNDLYKSLEAALKNTDLYLGFNSLDGD